MGSLSSSSQGLSFKELPTSLRESSLIGAEVHLPSSMNVLDTDALSEEDIATFRRALFENQVVVLKNQKGIAPETLPKLTKIFDPTATDIHSAGEKAVSDPRNILSAYKAGRIPRAPQVGIIGSGKFQNYEGVEELEVIHLDHTLFHEKPLSEQELSDGYTRPYRWHMDTPFYQRLPGEVTILHAVKVPNLPDQKLKFPDGKEKSIAAGATAFFSGARAFQLLTPAEQEFALNTTVTYAPQAYEYIRQCKATEDGLSIPTMGKEVPIEQLSEWSWENVAEHPMVWRNPLNPDRPFLQVHGCCVFKLTTRDPATDEVVSVVDDVAKVREIVYGFQKRIWAAENIYAHRWEEGDVVIFHNRGVMHSITGQLSQYKEDEEKKRLMWQCLHCEREVIHLRRDAVRHGAEIGFLETLRSTLQSTTADPAASVKRAADMVAARLDSIRSSPRQATEGTSQTTTNIVEAGSGSREDDSGQDDVAASHSRVRGSLTVTALEHMAWGRSYGNCYPHLHCNCHQRRNLDSTSSTTGLSPSLGLPSYSVPSLALLPERSTAETLISFHLEHIAWHHNSLHCPTFLQQCTAFWDTGVYDQPQWLALYSAVLSSSLLSWQNSWKHRDASPLALPAGCCSPQDLFSFMVDTLYQAHFLQNVSLYSVQAIVISTEVAHNLGLSQLNATLFSAAIRMAECLGIHKITDGSSLDLQTPEQIWEDTLQREVGRRVWLQMVIQDHFAIPFTDSYGINPAQYSTSLPRNADDADLVDAPETTLTVSTYTRVLGGIAQLMPELADGMGPLRAQKPAREQYAHVLRMDQKMREQVQSIPRFLLQKDELLEGKCAWLGVARQSLAITAAEKIVMIHRPFLFHSFQSDSYVHTRRTCVAAAVTILREHKSIVESGEVSLWTHVAFSITAAIILSFEVICDQSKERDTRQEGYLDAIRDAREHLLGRTTNDVLAHRGVVLIDAIFSEVGGLESFSDRSLAARPDAINFEEIAARFKTDWFILDSTAASLGQFDTPEEHFAMSANPSEDFDEWFQQIFHSAIVE
ncbi:alpha-ketoglutarate dependent xanthine dioxygenase [Colletotrichum camelliae]|nr:alpha-ketoglutarate dependent xanthine dioxygenase [Colletotrichum camelliae]KAH0433478.1 alpha-ketoglutarate dependent xanthine dioxygenase [Colletotrichum camelliae]